MVQFSKLPIEEPTGSTWRRRIVLLIGGTLITFAVYAFIEATSCDPGRRVTRATNCRNNLKQLGLALHNYLSVQGTFPPAFTLDANGRKMHSWRALLLPYIESGLVDEALQQYDFDQPWDSPHNIRLADRMPPVYRCPADESAKQSTTNYVAVVGKETFWPFDRGRHVKNLTDGLDKTIAIVEVTGADIPWLEPRDLPFDELTLRLNDAEGHDPSSKHAATVFVLMADGSALAMPEKLSPAKLRSLLTVDGGEKVEPQAP